MDEQDIQNEDSEEEGELMPDNILLEQELPLIHQVQIDHVLKQESLDHDFRPFVLNLETVRAPSPLRAGQPTTPTFPLSKGKKSRLKADTSEAHYPPVPPLQLVRVPCR